LLHCDNQAMTTSLQHLFDNNRAWAERMVSENPAYFTRLASQQNPKYLWIGCSDSRVPANQITGLDPGEVFVHRNVANVVVHSDLNALSVIQYAVDFLKVEHILVVGHYGCGGVLATLRGARVGLADNWLRHVHDVKVRHRRRLDHLPVPEQEDVLCEMNVIEQVSNVIQDAWARDQKVSVHGWCYGLKDGLAKDLGVSMSRPSEVMEVFRNALKRYPRGGIIPAA
jgi:carbonic anhydrase